MRDRKKDTRERDRQDEKLARVDASGVELVSQELKRKFKFF